MMDEAKIRNLSAKLMRIYKHHILTIDEKTLPRASFGIEIEKRKTADGQTMLEEALLGVVRRSG